MITRCAPADEVCDTNREEYDRYYIWIMDKIQGIKYIYGFLYDGLRQSIRNYGLQVIDMNLFELAMRNAVADYFSDGCEPETL